MSKVKIALGALIGAAAGVVAGILTAPKSGKETRAQLMTKKEKLQADVTKRADKLAGDAKVTVNDAKVMAEKAAKDVKAKAEDLKSRTESAVEGAKKGFNKKP